MTRVLLHGCNGHMGQVIVRIISERDDMEITAGVDPYGGSKNGFPVYESVDAVREEADVVIDFSNAGAIDALLAYCVSKKLPVILCTTGLSDEQIQAATDASKEIAVLRSANMSLGINTMFELLKKAVAVFGEAGFDIEIVEKHHNQKLDAPSGTAIALADEINAASGGRYEYVYDRSGRRQKREPKEIGISAVRGGTIVGDHDVIFAGEDEVITISHRAYSKNVFAKGAVQAASFLAGKPAGMYDMRDVVV